MGTREVELIRGEIGAVRGEMDRTIEQIAARLDVTKRGREHAARTVAALRDAAAEVRRPGPGPARRRSDLIDRARRADLALRGHPLASAVIAWSGIAVALLVVRAMRP